MNEKYESSANVNSYERLEKFVLYSTENPQKSPYENTGRKAFNGHFIQTRKYSWVIHIKNKHLNYYKSFCFKKYSLEDVKEVRDNLIKQFN